MIEFSIFGIYLAPIVPFLFAALLVFLPVRWILGRLELWQYVWHSALFEAALYLSIVSLMVLLWS